MKILLIDDDRGHVDTLDRILGRAQETKFTVTHADTLQAGLAVLQQQEVEIVALDLTLPDARYTEAFTQIFQHYPHIPVVVITGNDDEQLAYSLIVAGAQDFLVKGRFTPQQLIKTLLYAMARHTFRIVNIELQKMQSELGEITTQMAGIKGQYHELLGIVGDLNDTLQHSGGTHAYTAI